MLLIAPGVVDTGGGGPQLNAVRAQRLGSEGQQLWPTGGLVVSTPSELQIGAALARVGPDGSLTVVWEVLPVAGDSRRLDFLAMRLDSSGARNWLVDVAVCVGQPMTTSFKARDVQLLDVLPDGSTVVIWSDLRDNLTNDLYAQRITSDGVSLWSSGGRRIVDCAPGRVATATGVFEDDSGGCFVVLEDGRVDINGDITMLRLGPDGSAVAGWESGRSVSSTTSRENLPRIVPTGGGETLVFFVRPAGTYAQRFDRRGTNLWESGGRLVWPLRGHAFNGVVSDSMNGAILVGLTLTGSTDGRLDLVATRVDPDGSAMWGASGVPVSTAPGDQQNPSLAPDGSGGAFVVWEDQRAGPPEVDICAQHINADGTLGGAVTAIAVTAVSGARQGGCAELEWRTTESAGVGFELERSDDGGSWAPLARLYADGEGRVRWRECGLSPQAALAYRLSWRSASGTRTTSPITLPPEDAMTLTLSIANPVSERATIEYTLPEGAEVKLEVFDIAGRRLATPVAGPRAAGPHRLEWPARGAQSEALAPGAYVARLTAGGETRVVRLIVAR